MLGLIQNGAETVFRIIESFIRKLVVRHCGALRVRAGIASYEKKWIHIVQSGVGYKTLTSFVIGDDRYQPYERRTLGIMDEIEKLDVPVRDIPDALLSLLLERDMIIKWIERGKKSY